MTDRSYFGLDLRRAQPGDLVAYGFSTHLERLAVALTRIVRVLPAVDRDGCYQLGQQRIRVSDRVPSGESVVSGDFTLMAVASADGESVQRATETMLTGWPLTIKGVVSPGSVPSALLALTKSVRLRCGTRTDSTTGTTGSITCYKEVIGPERVVTECTISIPGIALQTFTLHSSESGGSYWHNYGCGNRPCYLEFPD